MAGHNQTIVSSSQANFTAIFNNADTYQVMLTVTDNSQQSTSVAETFTLTDKPVSQFPSWDASKVYWSGDVVTFNGSNWRAGWWRKGETPGTTGQWGVWRHYQE
ncbi:hypothetical protein N9R79_06665 [Vibrio sp.]|nr:hypothetical protein [Vibrio sp.]